MSDNEGLSMLAEHQGVTAQPGNGPTVTQTDEEKADVQLVNSFFDRAKKFRKKFDENWVEDYNFYRGRQWKEQRPSYRHSAVFNMVFRHIQGQVPVLTDAFPRFEFLPEGPEDQALADILSKVAESDWKRENWLHQVTETIFDSHFYGTGLTEVGFDPKAKEGIGSISIASSDPLYCFPDPDSKDVNIGGKFFIYAEPVSMEAIRSEYPDKGEQIKGDMIDPTSKRRAGREMVRYKSPTENKVTAEGDDYWDGGDGNSVLKITCYLRSDEIIEAPGKEGTEPVRKLKYPKGCKMVVAGGILLEKEENPYEDGKFPWAKLVNYIDPRQFWGISEIEQIKEPQKLKNKVFSFALDVLTLMGNPIWIVDDAANVDTDNLTNQPGLVVEKSSGGTVTREEGVQLQPWVLNLLDRVSSEFDDIAGENSIGKSVGSADNSGYAIDLLQQAQQVRLRQKARNIDGYMQNLGQLYMARVFQFYSIPRVIRLTNNQESAKYFKFYVENREVPTVDAKGNQTGVEQKKFAVVRNWVTDETTGQGAYEAKVSEFEIRAMFDIQVNTGTALPFAKSEKQNKALQLFDRAIIDDEEVLSALDYPNKEKVLLRMRAKRAEQAAMEAQAQGGGLPPAPPSPGNPAPPSDPSAA